MRYLFGFIVSVVLFCTLQIAASILFALLSVIIAAACMLASDAPTNRPPREWTPDGVFDYLNSRLNGTGVNIYTPDSGWGRRIGTEQQGGMLMWGEDIFTHTGWWTPKPRVGDLIVRKGSSGFYIASMFTEVRHAGNVRDMFFAKSAPITRSDCQEQWRILFRDYPKSRALCDVAA